MSAFRVEQPADLDVVRTSYDRVADNYVQMNLGDITTYPWLRTATVAWPRGRAGVSERCVG